MNRNTETHFSFLPNVEIGRSKFHIGNDHKTTFDAGELIPFIVKEVLPGDTFEGKTSAIVRMTTPIYPVMDNSYVDTYYFFVPNRLVWEHFPEFFGENKLTAWEQPTQYQVPKINAPAGGWTEGSLADYFGIPTKVALTGINHLPFRAYCKIWNDWFRNENTKDAVMFNTDETTLTGTNSGSYVTNAQLGAAPLKAAKFHDYFTSALPEPQKGPDVTIPLGTQAPVGTGVDHSFGNYNTLHFKDRGTALAPGSFYSYQLYCDNVYPSYDYTSIADSTAVTGSLNHAIYPVNLWADLTHATSATINQLRQAFQLQKFYERSAIGGTRYIELIKAHFGVDSPDARLQRSEYLGGSRRSLNIEQVVQNSATVSGQTPQGNVAAVSCTGLTDDGFIKSFTEHGYLIGLAVVRAEHTYQQGLNRMWSRTNPTDFYFPEFANLGEMPVYNKEIYAQATSADDQAFGYQEAWADYRYSPDIVTGLFRSNATGTLDSWHYADNYASLPTLSSDWNDEPTTNIARTLAVSGQPQFLADFYTDITAYRPMPLYSIPGLIDHH